MAPGQPVVFTENGVDYPATVLRVRQLDDHAGFDEEPMVDLGFFKPVEGVGDDGKPVIVNVIGTSRQNEVVQFRYDVVHESHEFSEEAQKKHGLVYGGGRWREPQVSTFTGRISGEDQ